MISFILKRKKIKLKIFNLLKGNFFFFKYLLGLVLDSDQIMHRIITWMNIITSDRQTSTPHDIKPK
jgi:hypothetical protein